MIVFPSRGERPHPQEMSGGDLDGDLFWISHHPDLVFPFNKDPFDASSVANPTPPVAEIGSTDFVQYTPRDVINFFVQYMENDK